MNIDGLLPLGLSVGAIVVALVLLRHANVVRYIPNNQVGIVEKLWSQKGSIENGFIALNGEAGFEPEVLRRGAGEQRRRPDPDAQLDVRADDARGAGEAEERGAARRADEWAVAITREAGSCVALRRSRRGSRLQFPPA